jgi:hypothetical protein
LTPACRPTAADFVRTPVRVVGRHSTPGFSSTRTSRHGRRRGRRSARVRAVASSTWRVRGLCSTPCASKSDPVATAWPPAGWVPASVDAGASRCRPSSAWRDGTSHRRAGHPGEIAAAGPAGLSRPCRHRAPQDQAAGSAQGCDASKRAVWSRRVQRPEVETTSRRRGDVLDGALFVLGPTLARELDLTASDSSR